MPADIPQPLRDALSDFDTAADELVKSFIATLETREPPPLIYHYTDHVGLRGILETGQMWLSDIFNLNDPSELSHGISHAVTVLNDRAEKGPPEARMFANDFAAFHELGVQKSAHYFVCSFSSDGDDLGQWRAYADNGRGYALEFDGKALETLFTKENGYPLPNNCTFPVTYDDATLVGIHSRMIDRMFGLISLPRGQRLRDDVLKAYMVELSVTLSVHALRAALFFKHEGYKNEQEYRFMQLFRGDQPPPDVKRRFRPYESVRYRTFRWSGQPGDTLKQIIVGPASDPRKGSKFAQDCLTACDIKNVQVEPSSIPYRAQ